MQRAPVYASDFIIPTSADVAEPTFTVPVKILPNYAGPRDETFLTPAMPDDAGIDLYSAEEVVLRPGERRAIPTGLAFAVPNGYEIQVRPKSGLALKQGLTIVNTPGTVDPGYRGEVMVIALNTNPAISDVAVDAILDALDGSADAAQAHEAYELARHEATIVIKPGQKIAQIVYSRFERPAHLVVTDLPASDRGEGGFGSTGT